MNRVTLSLTAASAVLLAAGAFWLLAADTPEQQAPPPSLEVVGAVEADGPELRGRAVDENSAARVISTAAFSGATPETEPPTSEDRPASGEPLASGVVRDGDGAPLAGVTVEVRRIAKTGPVRQLRETLTTQSDAEGRWTVRSTVALRSTLRIVAFDERHATPEELVAAREFGEHVAGIEIAAPLGIDVDVTTRTGNGQIVPAQTLVLAPVKGADGAPFDPRPELSLTCDAAGRASASGLVRGARYRVSFVTDRYYSAPNASFVAGEESEVVVLALPFARVSGIVLDEGGRPAAQVHLSLRAAGAIRSDENGGFVFTNVRAFDGERDLLALSETGEAMGRVRVVVDSGSVVDGVTVDLVPATRLRVQMRDDAGAAPTGAQYEMQWRGQDVIRTRRLWREVMESWATSQGIEWFWQRRFFDRIDFPPSGDLLIPTPWGGRARLVPIANGFVSPPAGPVVDLEPGKERVLQYAFSRRGTVGGRLLGDVVPEEGSVLKVRWGKGERGSESEGVVLAGGRWSVAGVGPGAIDLKLTVSNQSTGNDASAAGDLVGSLQGIEVRPGLMRNDLDVVLTSLPTVSGFVTDERGEPLVGARVFLRAQEGLLRDGGLTWTGPEGFFSLGTSSVGRHSLRVFAEGYRDFRDDAVDVQGSRSVRRDVVMDRGGTLRGFIRDVNGTPITNALITAVVLKKGRDQIEQTRSNAAGAYVIRNLSPGVGVLYASAFSSEEGGSIGHRDIEIDPSNGETEIDLELGAPLVAQGRVVGQLPPDLAGKRIRATALFSRRVFRGGNIGEDGRFEIRRLYPGRYRIEAPEGTELASPIEFEVAPTRAAPELRVALRSPGN